MTTPPNLDDPEKFPARIGGRVAPLVPISGWPLPTIIEFDSFAPGWLAACTKSRPLWRQAIFAAMASGATDSPERFLEAATGREVADAPWRTIQEALCAVLLGMRPRDIIEAAYGSAPDGFLGALDRAGYRPLSRQTYGAIHRLTEPRGSTVEKQALAHCGEIDDDKIRVIETLDRDILLPRLVSWIGNEAKAADVNGTVRLIRRVCSTASPAAIQKSVSDTAARSDMNQWLRDWLGRFDRTLVSAPIPGDEELVLLGTGAALADAGLRYRNCLTTKAFLVITGRCFFYEFKPANLIASVRRTADGSYWLSQVYARSNMRVPQQQAELVRTKFADLGMKVGASLPLDPDCYSAAKLFRAFHHAVFDGDLEDIFDD